MSVNKLCWLRLVVAVGPYGLSDQNMTFFDHHSIGGRGYCEVVDCATPFAWPALCQACRQIVHHLEGQGRPCFY